MSPKLTDFDWAFLRNSTKGLPSGYSLFCSNREQRLSWVHEDLTVPLEGANTDPFNPLVPKAYNSERKKILYFLYKLDH